MENDMSLMRTLENDMKNNNKLSVEILGVSNELVGFRAKYGFDETMSVEGIIIKDWTGLESQYHFSFNAVNYIKRQTLAYEMMEAIIHRVLMGLSAEDRAEALHLYEDHEGALFIEEGTDVIAGMIYQKIIKAMEKTNDKEKI
jgi:hypothetical protein